MIVVTLVESCRHELYEYAKRVQAYVREHCPPLQGDVECRIMVRDCGPRFSYDWSRDLLIDDIERAVWQGNFDVWNRQLAASLPEKFKSILIAFRPSKIDHEAKDTRCANKNHGLIEGNGLADFHPTEPYFVMDKLIAPQSVHAELKSAISLIKNRDLIYNQWGFSEVDPCPRAILNFYGPPGTGKTMAAHCIAKKLQKKILIANFAEIESKYVGDSPKNLENIFRVAERDDAVLFFDEADSFLGKRLTSVSSSSDQAVNSLRSQLLQLLETHSGVVIFCTNLQRNYDKAFESRILKSVKFDLPDLDCRKMLIKQMIPCKLPCDDTAGFDETFILRLAELSDGFSGRDIKNAILQTLCLVASQERHSFSIDDFESAFETMQKDKEAIKKEHGGLNRQQSKNLAEKIGENLKTGEFKVDGSDVKTTD